jgi:hypothetical protein
MTVQSASGLMFPGITGINGIVLAVPAAVASLTLPMLGSRISYNITILINTVLGMLALLFCTLGTGIAGPLVGTAIAGITSALGQYLYLAVAASVDHRVVITFSIGTSKHQYNHCEIEPYMNIHRAHVRYPRRPVYCIDGLFTP